MIKYFLFLYLFDKNINLIIFYNSKFFYYNSSKYIEYIVHHTGLPAAAPKTLKYTG